MAKDKAISLFDVKSASFLQCVGLLASQLQRWLRAAKSPIKPCQTSYTFLPQVFLKFLKKTMRCCQAQWTDLYLQKGAWLTTRFDALEKRDRNTNFLQYFLYCAVQHWCRSLPETKFCVSEVHAFKLCTLYTVDWQWKSKPAACLQEAALTSPLSSD